MQIVGLEHTTRGSFCVHTIDVWYSQKRNMWIVERICADGDQIGVGQAYKSEDEARVCLEEWLRTHDEAHLVTPRALTAAEKRIASALAP